MTPDPTRILDEIQARADAATEGPWTWAAHTTADGDEWAVFDGGDSALAANRDGWAPDAAFIAAARTDVPRLVAALRAVLEEHRPAHAVFSWSSGLRYEEPCPGCHGRAGVHPCGCWGDTDTEYVCSECDQPERGGSRRVAPYPCPTVTAITEALEER